MRKNHISISNVLGSLFLSAALCVLYLTPSYSGEKWDTYSIIITITVAVLFAISSVFGILTIVNKEMRYGDEYTTKIMHKAAFQTLRIILTAIPIVTIILVSVANIKVGYDGDISQFLSARIVLSTSAGIQILGTFLFSLLVFIYSKRGHSDGV